ncbi:acetolactate synthase 2 catalytic subunit [Citreicella sp. SE45]|nr:acetolactate synthase 2 catalytic subunit [Citreicella sp. SE45]
MHTAMQDSAPMILLVGQIATDMREREAFQEVNYRAVFGTMAKWVTEIDHADPHPPRWCRGPGRWPQPGGRGRWCWRCPRTC